MIFHYLIAVIPNQNKGKCLSVGFHPQKSLFFEGILAAAKE